MPPLPPSDSICSQLSVRRYQEWWYNSIIAHNYGSMDECQRFCEKDPFCGACDFWLVCFCQAHAHPGYSMRVSFACGYKRITPVPYLMVHPVDPSLPHPL